MPAGAGACTYCARSQLGRCIHMGISREWDQVLDMIKTTRGVASAWASWFYQALSGAGLCYIDASGALLYEGNRNSPSRVLIEDLRGCRLGLSVADSLIKIYPRGTDHEYIILQPGGSGEDYQRWVAALACWTPLRPAGMINKRMRFVYPSLDGGGERDDHAAKKTLKVGRIQFYDPMMKKKHAKHRMHRWLDATCMIKGDGALHIFVDNAQDFTHVDMFAESFGGRAEAPSPDQPNGSAGLSVHPSRQGQVIRSQSYQVSNNPRVLMLPTIRRSGIIPAEYSLFDKEYVIILFPDNVAPLSMDISAGSAASGAGRPSSPMERTGNSLRDADRARRTGGTAAGSSDRCLRAVPRQPIYPVPLYLAFDNPVDFEVWYVLFKSLTFPEWYGPDTADTSAAFMEKRYFRIMVLDAKIYEPSKPAHRDAGAERVLADKPPDTYVEIAIHGKTEARTRVKNASSNPFWREEFTVKDLPWSIDDMTITLKQRNKKSRDLAQDPVVGMMSMNISDIVKSHEMETWFPLFAAPGAKAKHQDEKVADICLKMLVNEYNILSGPKLDKLEAMLCDFGNNLTTQIVDTISASPVSIDLKNFASTFLDIFQISGCEDEWMLAICEQEIVKTRAQPSGAAATTGLNLLFRGNSLFTKACDFHMKRAGRDYLLATLGDFLQKIVAADDFIELDPNRLQERRVSHADTLPPEDYATKLLALLEELWRRIRLSPVLGVFPASFRRLFKKMRMLLEHNFEAATFTARYTGINGLLFLRLYCPAVLHPKLFGLLKEHPPPNAQRTLMLLAKGLQGLANQTLFGVKEPWMRPVNVFVESHIEEMKEFFNTISGDDTVLASVPLESQPEAVGRKTAAQAAFLKQQERERVAYQSSARIISRLPEVYRDSVPSLPYLIDRSVVYADLVTYWLSWYEFQLVDRFPERVQPQDPVLEHMHMQRIHMPVLSPPAIDEAGIAAELGLTGDLLAFHWECLRLRDDIRALKRACEPAESPDTVDDATWDHYVESLIEVADSPSLADAFHAAATKRTTIELDRLSGIPDDKLPRPALAFKSMSISTPHAVSHKLSGESTLMSPSVSRHSAQSTGMDEPVMKAMPGMPSTEPTMITKASAMLGDVQPSLKKSVSSKFSQLRSLWHGGKT
ncbi:uncharacterized protein V1510DRAFT_379687 [Dipodascopsis tothii]|uniref:uncharacterized protein n=1 Tax=Dipodascopsis tothii TaxID=44089 RepID=UPI0034CF88C0